jgi:hypothetical protein
MPPRPEFGAGAYTIKEFCAAHRLSEQMFYKLQKLGLGPDVMELGARRTISIEAAERWRKEREAVNTGITTTV